MTGADAVESLTVEVFGVTVAVTADPQHIAAVRRFLPPSAQPVRDPPERGRFALVKDEVAGLVRVVRDDESITGSADLRLALDMLDAELRMYIALHAPNFIFVHAGVVGVAERAIVLPGRSFAGKTTLVAALMQAGAEYWSDEYAVLDADGLVHPYPKPLSVRINNTRETDEQTIESLGGRAGDRPLPVAVIAFTSYRPGAAWTLSARTAGEGAVKLLEHSIAARSRPEQVLATVRRAVTNAEVIEGERGNADQAATALLSLQALGWQSASAPHTCYGPARTAGAGSFIRLARRCASRLAAPFYPPAPAGPQLATSRTPDMRTDVRAHLSWVAPNEGSTRYDPRPSGRRSASSGVSRGAV